MRETTKGDAVTRDDGDVAWLTAPQQHAWREYLYASRALELALDRQLLALGMTLAEYEIISMLSEAPGCRMRMSALADLVVQSRSRITHTATRLERRDWVERQPCANDSRGVELVLKDAGMTALADAAKVHVEGVRRYFVDAMEPEQFEVIADAMSRVRAEVTGRPRTS